MHLKNSLAQVEDQYNLKIFYIKLVQNINTNVNHAWETDGYTPILCKFLVVKICLEVLLMI